MVERIPDASCATSRRRKDAGCASISLVRPERWKLPNSSAACWRGSRRLMPRAAAPLRTAAVHEDVAQAGERAPVSARCALSAGCTMKTRVAAAAPCWRRPRRAGASAAHARSRGYGPQVENRHPGSPTIRPMARLMRAREDVSTFEIEGRDGCLIWGKSWSNPKAGVRGHHHRDEDGLGADTDGA